MREREDNYDDYYDYPWDDEEFERTQREFEARWDDDLRDDDLYEDRDAEPIGQCPDCDAPWFSLSGFCGGCA